MTIVRHLIVVVLCFSLAYADGNEFTKVRYNGGSVSTTVKPDDWDNKLTVTSDEIRFTLKDGQSISIPPKQVTSLSYGQEAHRNVGTAAALAVFSLGIGALSALHKTKLHYIGVNFNDAMGKKQGILLQGDKGNFRAILVALQGVTGLPVAVGEKDRNEIAVGVNTTEVPKEQPQTATAAAPPAPVSPEMAAATPPSLIKISSNPSGAEIYVDDALVGDAPTSIKLAQGKHTIRVDQAGYKEWSREIQVHDGSDAQFTATLEKKE